MASQLTTLLSVPSPPAFIYFHHPHAPSTSAMPDLPLSCLGAQLDAIEYHTPRLFYSGVASSLSKALCNGDEHGEVTTLDGLVRRVREVWDGRRKGKRKAGVEDDEMKVVLVVTKAERLRSVLGGGWAVVTRLAELAGIPMAVVLASQMPWDELRPPRGDALEPIHVYIPPPSRDDIVQSLLPSSQHPLWSRFLDLLLASLLSLCSSPPELLYLAEPLWTLYTHSLPSHAEQTLLNRPYPDTANPPPKLNITVKLLTDLKHQLALPLQAATESVLPRLAGRAEFLDALLLSTQMGTPRQSRVLPKPLPLELPTAARFLTIAAYCASYNPVKSDLRLFGRATGPDGRRKKGGGTRRAGYGRTRIGKVPQRLLGPKPFGLDRMLAMFSALYVEHGDRPEDLMPGLDDESESEGEGYTTSVEDAKRRAERRRAREIETEEMWEDEVEHLAMSVKLWALIPELEAEGLLRRMSPVDRLDNVMLRCEVDYETVKGIARESKITLDEYLYETNF